MAAETTQIKFTVTSSWLCPAGISLIFLDGCGGGGGGGGGGVPLTSGVGANSSASAGSAGGSAVRSGLWVVVIPNTLYTITIGAGGAGGAAGSNDGTDGSDTTFVGGGSTITFKGAGKGYWGGSSNLANTFTYCPGGAPVAGVNILKPSNASAISSSQIQIGVIQKPYEGGWAISTPSPAALTTSWSGVVSPYGFAGGAAGINGTTSTTANCGLGGGGASGSGFASAASATGGVGGNGNSAGTGGAATGGKRQDGTTSATAQTANTGVGGAGGGSGGQGSTSSGVSGAGGGGDSGILILTMFQ